MEQEAVRLFNMISQFAICGAILPIQIICICTLLRVREFQHNASLQIVARLIILDFLQTLALLITGFYHVSPQLAEFQPLRKTCSMFLIALFLGIFPLQFELTIFRILVISRNSNYKKLPYCIKLFEAAIWAGMAFISLATWTTDAYIFQNDSWAYNESSSFAPVLASTELYFCLPICSITYILYTALIVMIFSKRSIFAKEELPLFLQCTTMFLSETIGIIVYHVPEIFDRPEIYESQWFALFNTVNWTMSFAWTSLFLLICNRTVRSKLYWRSGTFFVSTTSLARSGSSC